MEGSDETSLVQRLQSSFGTTPCSVPKHCKPLEIPNLNTSQYGATHNLGVFNNNKMPITSPSSLSFPHSLPSLQIAIPQDLGSFRSRSLSQPALPSMNCLPPLSPFPHRDPPLVDVPKDDQDVCFKACESPVPQRGHRKSNNNMPLGFSAMIRSSPQLIPISGQGVLGHLVPAKDHLVKQELNFDEDCSNNAEGMGEKKSDGEVENDLFSTRVNLENMDPFNHCGTLDKDMDSRVSGTQIHGGENNDQEIESSLSFSMEKREGVKRSGGDIVPTARHFRSVSMDSFMGSMSFTVDSPKLPLSPGAGVGLLSLSNSMDANSAKFSLEFGNGEFSGAELKKIMSNDKLAEIALSDPKRAKRILANRQSAARSKERKMRYISELEHKVQSLQAEATTLSAQLKLLLGESSGLTNQNNELKFRLQAMEQQAQLRDALNEALAAEVQRLKLATAELRGECSKF